MHFLEQKKASLVAEDSRHNVGCGSQNRFEGLNTVVVDARYEDRGRNGFPEVEGYIPVHETSFGGRRGEICRCRHPDDCAPEIVNGNVDESGDGQRQDTKNGDDWIEVHRL